MRISDWSSDVCSSDLPAGQHRHQYGDETVGGWFLAREVVDFLLDALLVDEQRARLRGDDALVADQVDLGLVGTDRRRRREAERGAEQRSDARRGGKEWGGTCKSGWLPVQ